MSKHIEIINDLKNEKDLKQRVINTIVETEIYRIQKRFEYDGSDNKYRIEQARLFNILQNEFSRSDIEKLITKEIKKIVINYNLMEHETEIAKNSLKRDLISSSDLIAHYILKDKK